jgi:flagellar hook capping protein FlgD
MGNVRLILVLAVLAAPCRTPHAFAGTIVTPKVALHVSNATTKNATICTSWSPNSLGIPCSQYVAEGSLHQNKLVYMVIAQVDTPLFNIGIIGVSMGIEYNGNAGQGVDVMGWTLCSDGLEYPNAGPRGDWPASGGGNIVTWVTCQETRIGSDGFHAVVGAFSVYAYSGDQMRVTPNRNLEGGPSFALANCQGREVNPDTVLTLGRAGFGIRGINPCTLVPSGIGEKVPAEYRLYPNAPNPFRGVTRVAFDLPEPGMVALHIYDLSGRLVRVLADDWYPAGNHQVSWNARDRAGAAVAGGIYFLHLKAGSFSDTRRMYLRH